MSLDEPHFLFAVIVFIWHHTGNLEAHHRSEILQMLIPIQLFDSSNMKVRIVCLIQSHEGLSCLDLQ